MFRDILNETIPMIERDGGYRDRSIVVNIEMISESACKHSLSFDLLSDTSHS